VRPKSRSARPSDDFLSYLISGSCRFGIHGRFSRWLSSMLVNAVYKPLLLLLLQVCVPLIACDSASVSGSQVTILLHQRRYKRCSERDYTLRAVILVPWNRICPSMTVTLIN
jgi:hypothetical protein